ncbi:MAG: OmpA family protein, partial [Bacteroidetes bacterium]|nr:OmpA family protein [Bacteroidota bacterium]
MTKPKRLLIVLLVSIVTLHARSQVRLGLFGGPHSSSVIEKNDIPGWDTTTKNHYTNSTGIHIGVMVDIPLDAKRRWYFQPGINYVAKGNKYSIRNDSAKATLTDTIYYNRTLSINYIEIPFYFTYKLPLTPNHKSSFFISAGPYIGLYYNGNTTVESRTKANNAYTNNKDNLEVGNGPGQYKTFDFGGNARAGFELGNFVINGYFSRGVTSFHQATYSGTFNHQLVGGTIGFWLSKADPYKPKEKPKDTDKDGVTDDKDLCPKQPGLAKYNGCPIPDTDKDGINDEQDSCKTVAGLARYHGCPIPDTDGDGVNDEEDSCKTVAGLARYHGCPIPDTDHDGVNDEEDKCPAVFGSKSNQGCPLDTIRKETREQIKHTAKRILFLSGKAELTASSFASLNDLAALLSAHSSWKVTIEGHTDSIRSAMGNMVLSQKRADAIKQYLVSKGIASDRLTAVGYGDTRPLADNKTKEGRTMNRRVELIVT